MPPAAGVDRSLLMNPEVCGVKMGARGREEEEPLVQVSREVPQEGMEKEEGEERSLWEPDREKFVSLMWPACHQPCGHPRS